MQVSGADNGHEWTGYIPFDQLPAVFDPQGGLLATANGRIVPDDYGYFLANEWASPYRTERIYRLLTQLSTAGRKLKPEDMLRVQTDVYSEFDHYCAQRFVYAIDHAMNASPRARAAADLMRGWDGEVSTESVAPTITVAAERQLWRLLLEGKLGPMSATSGVAGSFASNGWATYFWYMSSVAMERILAERPPRWLPARYKDYDDLLAAAVDAAIARGDDDNQQLIPDHWRWGQRHPLFLQHDIFGRVAFLRHWSGPGEVPQSGDGHTVKHVGH